MRIRTNYITARDLYSELHYVNPQLSLDVKTGRSRTHARAFDVGLEFWGTKEKGDGRYRRNRNLGGSGFDEPYAATYDEWGEWLARLFHIDATMIAGQYRSRAHFHLLTGDKYR